MPQTAELAGVGARARRRACPCASTRTLAYCGRPV